MEDLPKVVRHRLTFDLTVDWLSDNHYFPFVNFYSRWFAKSWFDFNFAMMVFVIPC